MSRTASTETRERLLAAAGEVFAERGFRDGSVREIVARAEVNQAAISYHFGGKSELYAAVVRESLDRVMDGDATAATVIDTDPEQALRRLVRELVSSVIDDRHYQLHVRLLAWETLRPSGMLHSTATDLAPIHLARLANRLEPIVGRPLEAAESQLLAQWLLSSCLGARPEAAARGGAESERQLEMLVDQLTRLVLHGLMGVRQAR